MWGYYSRGGARAAKGALASPGNDDEDIQQAGPRVRSKGILQKISISGGFSHQGTASSSDEGKNSTIKVDKGKGRFQHKGVSRKKGCGLTSERLRQCKQFNCFDCAPTIHDSIKFPALFSPEHSSGTRTDPTQRRRAASGATGRRTLAHQCSNQYI